MVKKTKKESLKESLKQARKIIEANRDYATAFGYLEASVIAYIEGGVKSERK